MGVGRWLLAWMLVGCGPVHGADAGPPEERDATVVMSDGPRALPPASVADAGPPDAPAAVALPLSTCGRWIVDANRRRVKLAGVNWYGASDTKLVPGGLDKVTARFIAETIRDLGFNSVRLPFSNEMLHVTRPVAAADVAANPDLAGKTPLQVLDAAVEAITAAGLHVILNNHSTHAMWCCNYDDDGLWYTAEVSEESWIADWELVVARYAGNPRVVGADLRNELRIAKPIGFGILPRVPTWGGGGETDWAAAATRAGKRIQAKNPDLLIVVEGLNSADDLTGAGARPIVLTVPGKLVYEAHQYGFFRPGLPAIPGLGGTYGSMTAAALASASAKQWGYLTDPGKPFTAPVWLGEFGDSASSDRKWMTNLAAYLRTLDADFAYWALNGGPKAAGGPEPFGLLEDDWTTVRQDWRLELLKSLQAPVKGPGIAGETCP
jgi:endoglucanase